MNKRNKNKNQINSLYYDSNNTVHGPDINEIFLDACENGDYQTVRRVLNSIKDFNIDITDNLGRSALRLAVENEHLEAVEALLSKSDSSRMKEALLLAIYLGHGQIAESILKHPKYKIMNEKKLLNSDTDAFWQTPSSDDAQFSPDITPIMLAAQYNRVEIVQLLLLNGDQIIKPHDSNCKCTECHNRFKFDSLRHAQSRLNAFRGLASEAYISLASLDPILTSFELGYELHLLSKREKYFRNEYLQLAETLKAFTCKLLNNIRGRDELEIVLNKTGKEIEEKYERLARLDLAIKYEEKAFIAHPNCQQKLVEIWYSGIRKLSKMNPLVVGLLIILYIFLMPFLIFIYVFVPKSRVGRFMSQPCVKFVSHTVTYLVFIILIVIASVQNTEDQTVRLKFSDLVGPEIYDMYLQYKANPDLSYSFDFVDFYIRPSKPNVIYLLITLFVVGMIFQELKQGFLFGVRNYVNSWFNVVNAVMNVFYFASLGLIYYTMIIVETKITSVKGYSYWVNASSLNSSNLGRQRDIYDTIYWLNCDRFYWSSLDPINMAEGLFAVANLVSITRICFMMSVNQQLGPLQISLGKMISQILRFLVIFVIIFFGFLFALNNLYWYYQSNVRMGVQVADFPGTVKAESFFGTFLTTFLSLFWALFGLGDSSAGDISPFDNTLTEAFGYILYGAYHVVCIIILINMLIASMTLTYERIQAHTDTEWKFARSKLYMQYIKPGGTLPVPFNLIPMPHGFYMMFKHLRALIKRKSGNSRHPTGTVMDDFPLRKANGHANRPEESHAPNGKKVSHGTEELTYRKVMQRIVKRFLLHNQRDSADDAVGELEIDELKQDIQSVRFEMANDLQRIREDTLRLSTHLSVALSAIGDEIFKNSANSDNNANKFKNEFRNVNIQEVIINANNDMDMFLPKTPLVAHAAPFVPTTPPALESQPSTQDEELTNVTPELLDFIKEENEITGSVAGGHDSSQLIMEETQEASLEEKNEKETLN